MITLTYQINGVKFHRGYSMGMKKFALAKVAVLRKAGIEVDIRITGGKSWN